jgi:hypothetical protein
MVEGLNISGCDAAMEADKERMCGSSMRRKKARFIKNARAVDAVAAV